MFLFVSTFRKRSGIPPIALVDLFLRWESLTRLSELGNMTVSLSFNFSNNEDTTALECTCQLPLYSILYAQMHLFIFSSLWFNYMMSFQYQMCLSRGRLNLKPLKAVKKAQPLKRDQLHSKLVTNSSKLS